MPSEGQGSFSASSLARDVRPSAVPIPEARATATEQDRAIYALCRPERLLEWPTVHGVRRRRAQDRPLPAVLRQSSEIMDRVKQLDDAGDGAGGIVWHTQGSGKSLTMVMLAKALALDPDIRNPRIVLVTDRVDLDKQICNTFAACGLTPDRPRAGRHLAGTGGRQQGAHHHHADPQVRQGADHAQVSATSPPTFRAGG